MKKGTRREGKKENLGHVEGDVEGGESARARRVVLFDRPHRPREHLKRGHEPRLDGVNDGWA
eukprot:1200568-Rhodomonas_salina.1